MGAKGKGSGGRKRPAKKPRQAAAREVAAVETAVAPPEELITGQIEPARRLPAGRRKERGTEPPAPRLSNHKQRSTWFQSRAAWPVREAPVERLVGQRALARKSVAPLPGTAQWQGVGPSNIGGRLTCLVHHPTQPERIWAGAAGGGVWASPDGGQSWQALWHDQDVLNVGSLAIDPRDPSILYCGTGEANLSADSYPGVGIYRSVDGGASWHLLAPAEERGIPRRIGVVAIDPHDSSHLRIGGVGYGELGQDHAYGGLYTSRDGGATWRRETFPTPFNYWCHSIVFDPATQGVLYAAVTARGATSGLYRSRDDGATWEQLAGGLPHGSRFGRSSLALCLSTPQTLYALAADALSRSADLALGVFRSDDGGDSWREVGGSAFARERQLNYNNAIAVDPDDPEVVLCGGVDIHRTRTGGRRWTQVTRWEAARGAADYAHADHHALVVPAARPSRIYSANDGGLDVSDDGGRSWVNRSNGLAVTMYYDLDVSQREAGLFGGGTQDNGTLVTDNGQAADHYEILGGDGGWIVFDPDDASHLYASYYNLHIYRFRGGTVDEVSPPAGDDEKNFVWMCYIAMDPGDPRTLFTGSYRVWRTTDDGDHWEPVSPPLDGGRVSAIEIARADRRTVYVGTENGGIFRSDDGGDSWSANLAGGIVPGHSITRLAAAPDDAAHVVATVANFGHSHVFRSRDGGESWEDVDKGRLPDVPHQSLVIAPDRRWFVCNDAGVFVTTDEGATWHDLTRNLPNAMMVDLAYQLAEGTLTVATYGRSLWRIAI